MNIMYMFRSNVFVWIIYVIVRLNRVPSLDRVPDNLTDVLFKEEFLLVN